MDNKNLWYLSVEAKFEDETFEKTILEKIKAF